MRKVPIRFVRTYQKLRVFNERVFAVVATWIFSIIYVAGAPLVLLFAKSKISSRILSGWQPWRLKSDTLEEVRKQY